MRGIRAEERGGKAGSTQKPGARGSGDLQGKYLRHFSSRKSSTVCEEEESLVPCPGSQAHWVDVGVADDEDKGLVKRG